MAWLALGVLLVFLLLLAPLIGTMTQPFSQWWYIGAGANQPGVVPAPAVLAPQGPLAVDSTPLLAAIRPWLGVPYVFGGGGLRGVDCSAFTQATARQIGYSLPRTAQQQWDATARVSQPEPGDLVFFEGTYDSRPDRISHVGWYVGDRMMISAAMPAVGRQSLDSPFWRSHYVGAGRLTR